MAWWSLCHARDIHHSGDNQHGLGSVEPRVCGHLYPGHTHSGIDAMTDIRKPEDLALRRIARARYAGFLRNVAVAMDNWKSGRPCSSGPRQAE